MNVALRGQVTFTISLDQQGCCILSNLPLHLEETPSDHSLDQQQCPLSSPQDHFDLASSLIAAPKAGYSARCCMHSFLQKQHSVGELETLGIEIFDNFIIKRHYTQKKQGQKNRNWPKFIILTIVCVLIIVDHGQLVCRLCDPVLRFFHLSLHLFHLYNRFDHSVPVFVQVGRVVGPRPLRILQPWIRFTN